MKNAQHRDFPRVHLDTLEPAERFNLLIEPGTMPSEGAI